MLRTIRRENVLTLKEAAEREEVTYETMRQWTVNGRRGVVLESFMKGGIVHTSEQAIERFHEALTAARKARCSGNLLATTLSRSTPTAAAIAARNEVLQRRG